MSRKVTPFLEKYNLLESSIDLEKESQRFLKEMEWGLLKNKESSLAMIYTYLDLNFDLPLNEKVAVIDAGGTNLRTCLVSFNKNREAVIENFELQRMPGFDKEVSDKEFFAIIAKQVKPLLKESRSIGFSFSYEAQSLPNLDAIAVGFSKEIKAQQVIGKKLGVSLSEALKLKDKRVILLNDTVATLLAGKKSSLSKHYGTYVGYILGTGTNSAYYEKSVGQIINTETGAYDYVVGPLDDAFIKTTEIPSYHRFEKMVGGAYLGSFAHFVLKQAASDSVFEKSAFENIERLTTKEVSQFLENPYNKANVLTQGVQTQTDSYRLTVIFDSLIRRCAKLTALGISAAVLKSGEGKDPNNRVCVNVDGSTFYKTKNLKEYTNEYLSSFLEKEKNIYFELVHIESSPVIGAAIAALGN
ncbi:MAG: hexokinase [Sphaerochaetaceae bacterium]